MAAIHITLFGRLMVWIDNRQLFAGVPNTKPLELFAYLLVHRRRAHSRENLAALLWPDMTPVQARKNLRKVLCTLQRLLIPDTEPGHPVLLRTEQDWIAINSAAEILLDIDIFEQAYALAQQKAGTRFDIQTTQILTGAAKLYTGELLTGLYVDWCLYERERLENMYLELLHILMIDAVAAQAYDLAMTYGLELLRQDRANERAHCALMRMYYYMGNRTAALHQYEYCVAALDKELDVKPSKSTRLLYEQICLDELPLPPADMHTTHLPQKLSLHDGPHSYLQQIHQELQTILKQVQKEIHHVESMLQS